MSTQKATVEFILSKLAPASRFRARPMFGEYGLYADDKMVALVCDDQLLVKILPVSAALDDCERCPPYPGAKDYYVVDESRLRTQTDLAQILFALAEVTPAKKPKAAKIK